MDTNKNYGGLDCFKILAAFLVVAIHTSPLSSYSPEADFFLTRVVARLAVPFFLMTTGFFLLPDYLFDHKKEYLPVWRFVKKNLLLYGAAILLYLPVGIYAGHYNDLDGWSFFRMILFDGTFYHLWYLPASVLGVLLLTWISRRMPFPAVMICAAAGYVLGLLGDSYFGLIADVPVISSFFDDLFCVFSYTRNGAFYAPVFLAMGAWLAHRGKVCKWGVSLAGFTLSLLLLTGEGFLLRYAAWQRHDSMYLFLLPCMLFLYQLMLSWPVRAAKWVRPVSAWIYLLHPLAIVLVRGAAKAVGLTTLLVENSLIHYLTVCLISSVLAIAVTVFFHWRRSRKKTFPQDRAWIELDQDALRHNVDVLRSLLPARCELMPAVKANAYGHGAVLICRELNDLGIRAFCVATAKEGAALRRKGIKGDILVLGYTHPELFFLLRRYRLAQTVVDLSYARLLQQYGRKIRVHVGVDTGMHRLGERCENVAALCTIFRMKNLKVQGIFTHLCADDTRDPVQKQFTEAQGFAFYELLTALQENGFSCPKIHLQASYGVLNYPELSGDYARVGIALYGMLSTKKDTENCPKSLRPVLSVKARIAAVKKLYCGEAAGYGLDFVADQDRVIAVLAIGYADGVPRNLSNGAGCVLVDGFVAPIIGRVCMDQTLVDVTGVPTVKTGDIAVLIGTCGGKTITACDIAEQAGTISNEILSRLGERLERQVIRRPLQTVRKI